MSSISAGTDSSGRLCRPVDMSCDAALSRTVRNILSSIWESVRIERLFSAAYTSPMYLSQFSFFMLHRFDVDLGRWSSSSVI